MGVWIETCIKTHVKTADNVTPFVGVWIETMQIFFFIFIVFSVTPFVGVWIETCLHIDSKAGFYSHTLRGCVD